MNRFDYIAYDEKAKDDQAYFKKLFMDLECAVHEKLKPSREKALVMTKLEEAYMWVGKAIRDDQVSRNSIFGKADSVHFGEKQSSNE